MRLGAVLLLTLVSACCIQYSVEDPSQDTALSSSQTWQDEYQPEEYRGEKEEENTEESPQRRPRGKRRRRMRKRQRTQLADEVDRGTNVAEEAGYDRGLSEDEGVTPVDVPRRRVGKRRRRPLRRYQDEDGAPLKPLRRRRKGGRKKVRVENQEEASQTQVPDEQAKNDEQEVAETTTQMSRIASTTTRTTPSTTVTTLKMEETMPTQTVKVTTTVPSTLFKKEEAQDIKIASNAVKTEIDEVGKAFGGKIFDRKKLFSNPRRTLPVTSAIIRKLGPNLKGNTTDSLTPPTVPREKGEPKGIDKTAIKTNLLLDGTTNPPKEIKPEKLVDSENRIPKAYDSESEDEEPNYPKIIPRPIFYRMRRPTVETTTTELVQTTRETTKLPEVLSTKRYVQTTRETTKLPEVLSTKKYIQTTRETTKLPEVLSTKRYEIPQIDFEKNLHETSTNSPPEPQQQSTNKTMTVKEFEKMLENIDLDTFNITHFDDYILDLIQSKNGKEHLSKILESRNMTITQLLEHRERGSSKFHLFEMFPQKKAAERLRETTSDTTTTTKTTTTTRTSRTPATNAEPQKINFPSEEVLGSFPKFLKEEIERNEEKEENVIVHRETERPIASESREPRVFDSMPEFTTLSIRSTTRDDKHPTWRIIPNPKLRPVSVRGNYQEIPVSHVLNRPLENNVNDIYLVDERDELIHHKKYGLESLDPVKTKDTFGHFKRIPVGVKSAIIISGIILAIATFGFLSLLISCRVRQKRSILRAKQDLMCEHLQNDDFMTSQQSLSPVLTKHQQAYAHAQEHHSHPHNRHYYLWRTIRRTFRYD